jgi:hypothetical protein
VEGKKVSKLFDMVPQQQSTQYYQAAPPMRGVSPQGPLHAVKDGSLGDIVYGSPLLSLAKRAHRARQGTGAAGDAFAPEITQEMVVTSVVLVALTGALYYQAGKAMQPAGSENWGWWGALWGIVGGPLGIGIMGAVANSKKG